MFGKHLKFTMGIDASSRGCPQAMMYSVPTVFRMN